MKKLLLVVAALVASFSLSAQSGEGTNPYLSKGDQIVSGTIGLGNVFFPTGDWDSKFPPIELSYEYGLLENAFDIEGLSIGVGGSLGYTNAIDLMTWGNIITGEVESEYGYTFNVIRAAAKGYVHYDVLGAFGVEVKKLDTYAAISVGLVIENTRLWGEYGEDLAVESTNTTAAQLGLGISLGARYWFTEKIAANLERGGGLAILNLGASFRF